MTEDLPPTQSTIESSTLVQDVDEDREWGYWHGC